MKASIWAQVVISQASATRAHQIWFWARSCSGRLRSPVSFGDADAVLGTGAAAVAQFEVGELAAGTTGSGVGGKGGDPVAVGVGQAQLRARVRAFAADDDPHPGWPAGQVE